MGVEAKYKITATDASGAAFRSANSNVTKLSNAFKSVLPVAAIAGFAGIPLSLGAIIKSTIDTGDELNDLSKKTGTSVENLSGLGYVAKLTGGNLDSVGRSLNFLNKQLFDVAHGNKVAKEIFKELQINPLDQNGNVKNVFDIVLEGSERIKDLTDEGLQAGFAMSLFGKKTGQDMIPMMKLGSQEIARMTGEFKKYDLVTTPQASRADEFHDNLEKLKLSFSGVARVVVSDLLPPVSEWMQKEADWIAANKEFIAQNIEGKIKSIGEALKEVESHKDIGNFIMGTLNKSASGWDNILDYLKGSYNIAKTVAQGHYGEGRQDFLNNLIENYEGTYGKPRNVDQIMRNINETTTYNPNNGPVAPYSLGRSYPTTKPKFKPDLNNYKNKNVFAFSDLQPDMSEIVPGLEKANEDLWYKAEVETHNHVMSIEESWRKGFDNIEEYRMNFTENFINSSEEIENGWANAIGGMTGKAYNFKNIAGDMFDSILQAYRRMLAQMAAEELFSRNKEGMGGLFSAVMNIAGHLGIGGKADIKAVGGVPGLTDLPKAQKGAIFIKLDAASEERIIATVYDNIRRNGVLKGRL